MALLWLDSFDHYATADIGEKYATISGVGAESISAGNGRRSSACLDLFSFTGSVTTPTFAPGNATAIVGVALKTNYLDNGDIFQIRSGATAQVQLALSSGFVRVLRGAGLAVLGTAVTGALTTGTFYFIELKAVIHPSAGSIVVRVNGAVVLTLSGINTAQTGVASWDNFYTRNAYAGGITYQFDDLYILDGSGAAPLNDLIGDCRVDARYPTAEGASSAWTPLSGTDNALMVDETAPDDDTTYNATATVGATDTHVTQDAPVVGGTLYGVQVCLSQKKSAAGTCSIAPVIRHSGTDYPGTATDPTTSYLYACTPYGTNPGTSAAWTEAGFNAAEFGYKRTA